MCKNMSIDCLNVKKPKQAMARDFGAKGLCNVVHLSLPTRCILQMEI